MFPDFIGIGAQKAGTTWLAHNLQAHPEIHMPRKEVHYFDRKVKDRSTPVARIFGKRDADEQWRRQIKIALRNVLRRPSLEELRWSFNYYMRSYDDGWYASVFEPKKGKMSGEITPAYSVQNKERVAHVHELMPEAKIIFLMRNPIERVWSHAVMSFDKAEKRSVTSASEEELFQKLGRNSTWKLSNYLRTFENWGSFYPEERFFVGFLEDSSFLPKELLRELYTFLGVDPSFDPPLAEKKIHTRSAGTMPSKVAVHLAHNSREEIARLNERFGGYASFWLFCAERLIEEPPEEEEITYPLFESSLWEEWANGPGNPLGLGSRQLQSGTLSSIQVTA